MEKMEEIEKLFKNVLKDSFSDRDVKYAFMAFVMGLRGDDLGYEFSGIWPYGKITISGCFLSFAAEGKDRETISEWYRIGQDMRKGLIEEVKGMVTDV